MICNDCEKEMGVTESCTEKQVKINKKMIGRDTEYFDLSDRCHDCGIVNKKGNIHHSGCDMERCPVCKGQLISCNCDVHL